MMMKLLEVGVFEEDDMGYLDDTTGVLSGVLPAPHDRVRIEVGPAGNRVYVAYSGRPVDLLAAGAIDPHMMEPATEGAMRDAHSRPCRWETLTPGNHRITRIVASLSKVADLPGIGRRQTLGVGALKLRRRPMRLVVSRPEEAQEEG